VDRYSSPRPGVSLSRRTAPACSRSGHIDAAVTAALARLARKRQPLLSATVRGRRLGREVIAMEYDVVVVGCGAAGPTPDHPVHRRA
jgi:hypothetical protein